jgi:hypothetical protein
MKVMQFLQIPWRIQGTIYLLALWAWPRSLAISPTYASHENLELKCNVESFDPPMDTGRSVETKSARYVISFVCMLAVTVKLYWQLRTMQKLAINQLPISAMECMDSARQWYFRWMQGASPKILQNF